MSVSEKAMEGNRRLWDAWAEAHFGSAFYGVDEFRAGESTLPDFDTEAVGAVDGKRLLHLQCHFGLDTLSWARLGAVVTGLDFSLKAVGIARRLAESCGLRARFVHTNVYEAAARLGGERFPVVLSTAGVLPWLPDIPRWATVVASVLEPGGLFYLREFHPVSQVFCPSSDNPRAPELRYPYFPTGEPIREAAETSYAGAEAVTGETSCEWPHSLGEVVQSLLGAGLRLETLREFPFTTYRSFPWLEEGTDGHWRWPGDQSPLPLMYSLRCRAPDGAKG